MPDVFPSPRSDVFPAADQEFQSFCSNLKTQAENNATATPPVGNSPTTDMIDYNDALVAFTNALSVATNPATRTVPTITAKDTARADLEVLTRSVCAFFKTDYRNGFLTEQQLNDLGLKARKIRSVIPAPPVAPVVAIPSMRTGSARVAVRDPRSLDRRAMPYEGRFIETQISFAGVATAGPSSSKSTFDLTSDSTRVGQQATLRCRYVNAKAQPGPWSDPVSYVVT